jgi:hypothetical protein
LRELGKALRGARTADPPRLADPFAEVITELVLCDSSEPAPERVALTILAEVCDVSYDGLEYLLKDVGDVRVL